MWIDIKLIGVEQLKMNLKGLEKEAIQALNVALRTEANKVLWKAISITPIKTGALRRSGKVEKEKGGINEIIYAISFGSRKVGYAAPVHDKPARHPIGQWKYLETPWKEITATLIQDLVQIMKSEIGI